MARLPFTLEQIRTFLAVARFQSMSRAAESLYLTQGAVSQQVANLETALGLRLLERSGRRVWLTDAGQAIAAACEGASRAVDGVSETARKLTNLEAGSIHIGASPTAAGYYLPTLLASFTTAHPGVQFRVVTENSPSVAAKVAGGVLDCAMIEGKTVHAELLEHRLAEDEVIVVTSPDHALATQSDFKPATLAAHRFLAREPGAILEAIASEILGDRYDTIRRMEFGHLDAVRGAALAGLGFAVMPRVAVARELDEGRLVELPIPARRRWISVVRRPSEGGAALEELWRLVTADTPRPLDRRRGPAPPLAAG